MINFRQYSNATKIIIPNGVRLSSSDFSRVFEDMQTLINSQIPNSITNMSYTYYNCSNLTGSPVCGEKVINMINTYHNCQKLTGSPVCGKNVTNMSSTYSGCVNLTGSPVCGEKVTDMYCTYIGCRNLIGSPVCDKNVINMSATYYVCLNLTGYPVCGENVTDMSDTYSYCQNLASNGYFYSNKITNMKSCFSERNVSAYLNLYLPANSTSLTTALTTDSSSLVGGSITWTNDMAANNCYYNTQYNIYIYPVENVAAAAIANGDEEANANAGIE